MVETIRAQQLPPGTRGGATPPVLEPGTELRARVEANLPGGIVRLVSEGRPLDLRVPSPLPVGSDVTVSVSGTRQRPEIALTAAGSAAAGGVKGQQVPSPQGQTGGQTTGQTTGQGQGLPTGSAPLLQSSAAGGVLNAGPSGGLAQALQAAGALPDAGTGGAAALVRPQAAFGTAAAQRPPSAPPISQSRSSPLTPTTGQPASGAVPNSGSGAGVGAAGPATGTPPPQAAGAAGSVPPPPTPGSSGGSSGGVPPGGQISGAGQSPVPVPQSGTGSGSTPIQAPNQNPVQAPVQAPAATGSGPSLPGGALPGSSSPGSAAQGQGVPNTPLSNATVSNPAGGAGQSRPSALFVQGQGQATLSGQAGQAGQAAAGSLQRPTGPAFSHSAVTAYTSARPGGAGGAAPASAAGAKGASSSALSGATPVRQLAAQVLQPLAEQQASLAGLFSQMSALTAAQAGGQAALPDAVQKAMQQIFGLRLNPGGQPLQAAVLKQAVLASGQFREAHSSLQANTQASTQTAAGLGGGADLKSALLSFRSLLQGLGAVPAVKLPAYQPPLPSRQGGPSGQAAQTASGFWAGGAVQNLQALLQETDAALARMRLTQLVNAGLGGDEAIRSAATRPMDVVLEVPLAFGQETSVMQMQIGRDGGGQAGKEDSEPGWRLRFALDLIATGPLEAAVSLRGGSTFISLWLGRAETLEALALERDTMEAAFADAGLDLKELRFIKGLPPKTAVAYGAVINRQS